MQDRLKASEEAVTAALRAYSSSPTDEAMDLVTQSKKDEKEARKRMYTSQDSMTLRKSDLEELREQYDEAMKATIARRRVTLLKLRRLKLDELLGRIREPLIETLVTAVLEGSPIGMIDLDVFLKKRFEGLKVEVERRVQELLKELEDG